jgi:hypothetical protein
MWQEVTVSLYSETTKCKWRMVIDEKRFFAAKEDARGWGGMRVEAW